MRGSGRIRTQIGLAKKRLKEALERSKDLSTLESLRTDPVEEIYQELIEICDISDILRAERERILQLDKEWKQLFLSDAEEQPKMEDYKRRLGDYMEEIKPIPDTLRSLEQLYNSAREIHQSKAKTPEEYPEFNLPAMIEKGSYSADTTPPRAMGTTVDKESVVDKSTVSVLGGTMINAKGITSSYPDYHGMPQEGGPIPPPTNQAPDAKGSAASMTTSNNLIYTQSLSGPLHITLPNIKLPSFNGDTLQFTKFMDLFDTLIGQQPMTDMAKFHYLVSSLEGEASTLIQFLPMTADNYPIALSILKDNFGNGFYTRQQLIRQLQDLPSIASTKNIKDILTFWNKATFTFNQLKRISPECDSIVSADILLRKLPKFYLAKIFGTGTPPEYTASQLLNHVHRLIQADRLLSVVHEPTSKEERSTTMAAQTRNSTSNQQHRNHGQRSQGNNDTASPRTPCAFCVSQEHYHRHHECPTYRTVTERQDRARQLKLCFKCLKKHDNFRSCPRVPRCRKCNGNHQTSFCRNDTNNDQRPADQQQRPGDRGQVPANDRQKENGQQKQSGPPAPNFNQKQPSNQPRNHQNSSNFNPSRQQNNQSNGFVPRRNGTTNAVVTEDYAYDSEALVSVVTDSVQLHVQETQVEEPEEIINDERTYSPSKQILETQPVAMMTAQVLIDDKEGNPVLATVFFDSGSDRSFISSDLLSKLHLPVASEQKLRLNTFANDDSTELTTKNFMVNINLNDEKLCIQLTEIPIITTKINFVQIPDAVGTSLLESNRIKLPRLQIRPDILIGLDHMSRLLGETTCQLLPNGMTMHHTDCGIIITGREREQESSSPDIEPFRSSSYVNTSLQNTTPLGILATDAQEEHHALRDLIERFWTIDTDGGTEYSMNKDEEEAYKFFFDTTTRDNEGRYIVRWPYREDTKQLPDNRFLALYRLQSTMKRLSKDSNLEKQYQDIILDQLSRDFVEFVDDEKQTDGEVVHYLSHHPVIKMSSKSTKVRIVFDASAHANKDSKSLNDVLHTGMSLLPMIPGVLIRIRCPQILISGDIEKAFLQLGLDIRDRDACRFLWQFPEENQPRCLRFKRVPFGVKTSPYLLNAAIKQHLQEDGTEISQRMLRNVYVDNIFIGSSSVEEGKRSYKESKAVFQEAQMRLTQYFSNSPELNDYMNREEGVKAEDAEQKILGIEWNTSSDHLRLKLPKPISEQLTKRRILKTIATAYDPIGLLAPIVVLGKLFFQKLWLRTMDWDSMLTAAEMTEWQTIERKWAGDPMLLPRNYFKTPIMPNDVFEVHIFSDASAAAYGAVAYLRRLSHTFTEAAILTAKARVAPVKTKYSIPQLELLGLGKAADLGKFLLSELDLQIERVYIWSDSLCSVDQLSTNKANSIFSRNRLKKIREALPQAIISHVPGKINPADLVSRGCGLEELRDNDLWWKGPSFLNSTQELPIRESSLQQAICSVAISTPDLVEPMVDPNRFSSFHKMLSVIMTVLLFMAKIRKVSTTSAELREKAKLVIIRIAQALSPPTDEMIDSLHLQLDQQIWYYDGRQPSRRLPFLPHGTVAKLLIMDIHKKFHHSSVLYTLSKLREEVWINKGLSTIKKTLKECLHCKRNSSRPFYQPDFPPLPDIRLHWHNPFTNVGMDYAGPVKATNGIESRKYYFVLFTCLTTRFTTVELVTDMESRSLLNAIRRVAAQFGCPQLIYTDNASQIKLLEKVIHEARNQQNNLNLTSNELPAFRYIPALSPWSGGIYERVVGILKKCLVQAGTTRRLLAEDDLRTLLAEAVSIINDRPLTATTSDMDDLRPLRPTDLVHPNKQRRTLLNVEEILDTLPLPSSQASLLEDWMRLSSLSRSFISRWNTEYLQMLQERNQLEHKQSHLNRKQNPQVGDIVLIDESGKFGQKRGTWPLAKVVEVDSRSAKLFNSRTKQIVERPFRYIVPLEITSQDNTHDQTPKSSSVPKVMPSGDTGTVEPIAHRTRSRNVSTFPTTAMMLITLLSLSTLSAAPLTTNDSHSTKTLPNQMNIEDVSDTANSLLREIALRLGYSVGIIGIISILYCISVMLHITSFLLPCIHCFWRVLRTCCMSIRKPVCRTINVAQQNTRIGRTIFMIFMLSTLFAINSPCTEVAHINSKETVCYNKESSQECVLNTVSIVNLRTMGSTSCLQFYGPTPNKESGKNEMIFSLMIEAEAILMHCNKHVVFYARDHKLEFEFSRRCDSAGSCSIDKCSKIQPDEDLPELSNHAKNSPGFTSCTPGCGCINCGCFYCDPSCLFYRYYAQPTSKDLYEISRCATWTPSLRTRITVNNNSTLRQILRPGIKFGIPGTNISITAINLDNPPMPVHQATFVSAYSDGKQKWQSFTHTQPSAPGVPTRGLVGELHCGSKSDAEAFKCKFDPALCRCIGFATKVSCNCQASTISDFAKERKLPFKGQHHTIYWDSKSEQTVIETTQESIVALQIEAVNASVSRHTNILQCQARQVTPFQGCHSCEKSALSTLVCHSSKPTKALISCPYYSTTIECGPKEISTDIRMSLSSPPQEIVIIDLNCSVSCGITTSIRLQGRLEYEASFRAVGQLAAQAFEDIADVSSILGSISQWFYDVIFEKIFSLVLFLFFIIGICYILRFFIVFSPTAAVGGMAVGRMVQRRRQKLL